jgi:nicotinate phosphoribosyltransferase
MDEYRIAELIASGAPIDGFGVGTRMAVSADAPHLDMAYKLVEYDGRPRMKLTSKRAMYPGRKQVFRESGANDTLGCHDEALGGEPLLQPVMRRGQRLPAGRISLQGARQLALAHRERLPPAVRGLQPAELAYPVRISERLRRQLESTRTRLRPGE